MHAFWTVCNAAMLVASLSSANHLVYVNSLLCQEWSWLRENIRKLCLSHYQDVLLNPWDLVVFHLSGLCTPFCDRLLSTWITNVPVSALFACSTDTSNSYPPGVIHSVSFSLLLLTTIMLLATSLDSQVLFLTNLPLFHKHSLPDSLQTLLSS